MAIPAYLWLKDDAGALIKGAVDVQGRESSIVFLKAFDSSSPYLFKAVCTGQTLISAVFKWYRINDAGQEVEYNNMLLENVRIVGVLPVMHDTKDASKEKHNHLECVEMCYEKITWKHCDGNILFSDSWNERL